MNTDRPIQVERPVFPPKGARPVSSIAKRRSLASFTLIELLIVVAVILILLGISMKVLAIANRHTQKAKTLSVLEQVKNVLGAYYTQYGVYPPVDSVKYIYELTPAISLPIIPKDGMGYKTGLVYYIYYDLAAGAWAHYSCEIAKSTSPDYPPPDSSSLGSFSWTNNSTTILDGWDNPIQYNLSLIHI